MFLVKMLYQFIKDSFVVPSTSVMKNSNIFQKYLVYLKTFYLQTFLLLTSTSITSYYTKLLQKSLFNQQNKLSSPARDYNLPIFTANKIITNLLQYELSQEESDLLKAGLYFSIQPDKIQKSEIFTTFEKIHRLFLNNLTSEETKTHIKTHCLLSL